MTNLSVNINKVATIRNARGGNVPNVEQVAIDCERFGADGITVHPRPDERHIRYADVFQLRPLLRKEFNIEGYPSERFMDLVLKVKPTQVTLVPRRARRAYVDRRMGRGEQLQFLQQITDQFKEKGIRTSIFVDTDIENIRLAAKNRSRPRGTLHRTLCTPLQGKSGRSHPPLRRSGRSRPQCRAWRKRRARPQS